MEGPFSVALLSKGWRTAIRAKTSGIVFSCELQKEAYHLPLFRRRHSCVQAGLPRRAFPGSSEVKSPLPVQEAQEMRAQSLGREEPLEEEMATVLQCSGLGVPRTEEPGGLQSVGS